jgi:cyclopropane-fatty-acyl-phospholipid synthase
MLRDRLFSLLETRLSRVGMPLSVDCWNGWHLQTGETPQIRLRLRAPSALQALIKPRLGKLAESYVKNIIDVDGRIADVIRFGNLLCATDDSQVEGIRSGAPRARWFRKHLSDRDAIARHYDVSNDFYALWLDRQRVYSCAYFKTTDDSLDLAQEQKIEHVCRKLQLTPGDRLLDVGCGWGALIFHAVERYNHA